MRFHPFLYATSLFLIANTLSLAEEAPAHKIALLVGVNHYQSPDIMQLEGCDKDVADVQQLLTTKFGFPKDGIEVLLDDKATHQGVVEAFQKHLIAQADARTSVVFYFSGHGSQVPDDKDPTGQDETICPTDTRLDGKYDITSKEIAGLLKQLRQKTDNVTVIFDSCHSGNATRGKGLTGARPRLAPPDKRRQPPPPAYAAAARGFVDPSPEHIDRYTVLAACQADQLSYELQCNGDMRGAFTYYFMQAVRGAESKANVRVALEQARAHVKTLIGNQNPVSEGNLDRVPFGDPLPAPHPFFLVQNDGAASLQGGAVEGLTTGSIFDCYPSGTTEFRPGKKLGQFRITAVTAFRADIEPLPPMTAIPDLARAVEAVHSFGKTPFGVYVHISNTKICKLVEKAVTSIPGTALAASPTKCNLAITDQDSGEKNSDQLRLLDPSGLVEFATLARSDASQEKIAALVRTWSSWLNAVMLENPLNTFHGEFEVTKLEDKGAVEKKGFFTPEQAFHPEDHLQIRVKNNSAAPLYLYLLDFGSDGKICQIHPRVGTTELLPPDGELKTTSTAYLPAGVQRMEDVLKLVVSVRPLDFSGLINCETHQIPKDPNEFLRSMSPTSESSDSDFWATAQRVFEVRQQ